MTTETHDIAIGLRVNKRLYAELIAEQQRIEKLSGGIKPSITEVARMLLERGLAANGRRR